MTDTPALPEDQLVYLVVFPSGGIGGAYVGDRAASRAHKFAEATDSVIVELPIATDYRRPS